MVGKKRTRSMRSDKSYSSFRSDTEDERASRSKTRMNGSGLRQNSSKSSIDSKSAGMGTLKRIKNEKPVIKQTP